MVDSNNIETLVRAIHVRLDEMQADIRELKARPDTALLMQLCERIIAEHRSFGAKQDRMWDDMQNLKARASNAERQDGEINSRLDHIDLRLERIEHRLELSSAEPPR